MPSSSQVNDLTSSPVGKWVKHDFKLVEKLFKQAEQNNTQAINPENLETEMGDW
ncbi:hypothetical protein IV507_02775 [Acinetobacter nosocomialis]|uniref:hypothetical protein n=1 Tax=Acinetobacter nosocomialis TaxID=106654 RepID=UPI002F3F5974